MAQRRATPASGRTAAPTAQDTRKLAAIMFTDMVGYSSLTQKNEALALKVLEEQRSIIRPLLAKHGGHEIKTIGDAFLVEFASALAATTCALEIQRTLFERQHTAPSSTAITLRIGLHVGDVVYRESDVFGDGVNIAARIEPLAKPGGICLSEDVARQVQNKIDYPLVRIGRRELKNIHLPVQLYRVVQPWHSHRLGLAETLGILPTAKKAWFVGAGLLLAAFMAAASLWGPSAPHGSLSPRKIVVLPFENLGPAEHEYFAVGLSDEITSRLSSIRELGVISRTSANQYKKTSKTIPEIGKELGVDYILEGSVRWETSGKLQRIRVTPHLVQTAGDVQLWTESMDRTVEDIFAIQTEIGGRVVKSLDIVLRENEKQALNAIPTSDLEAYDSYLRGRAISDRIERLEVERSIAYFAHAVRLDSTFAAAFAELALAHFTYYWLGFDHTQDRFATGQTCLERAAALQPDLAAVYLARGFAYEFESRDYDRALEAFREAEKRQPNNSAIIAAPAFVWRRQGKFAEATERLKKAFELDPQSGTLLMEIGNTLRLAGNYPEAMAYFDRSIRMLPDQSLAYELKAAAELARSGDIGASRRILNSIPSAYSPPWLALTQLDIYERSYVSALDRLATVPDAAFEDNLSVVPVSLVQGLVLRLMGRDAPSKAAFSRARKMLEARLKQSPDDFRLHSSLGLAYAGLGHSDAAVREAERGVLLMPVRRDAWAGVTALLSLARVYAMVGRQQEALETLSTLLASQAAKEVTAQTIQLDPLFEQLRTHTSFRQLLAYHGSS